MNDVQKIQDILRAIKPEEKNRSGSIYLNSIKNEFITFPGRIAIPKIPVRELPYGISIKIVNDFRQYFPEFLLGHALLEKRKPAAEVHTLQFAMPMKGRVMDFTHYFKIDLRFGGDSSNVIEKGDTVHYPSYNTNRIYYKSRLIPTTPGEGGEFLPVRLLDELQVESDMHFRTFAMFDEMGSRELTKDLQGRLDPGIFSTSQDLYPFIVFDFFTACLNVPRPSGAELVAALEIFEPLFLVIYGRYKNADAPAGRDAIMSAFPDHFSVKEGALAPAEGFIGRMQDYFKRYKIIRDDDLALKGWWMLDIANL